MIYGLGRGLTCQGASAHQHQTVPQQLWQSASGAWEPLPLMEIAAFPGRLPDACQLTAGADLHVQALPAGV